MTDDERRALAQSEVWLFDLDNTLYPTECRLFDQIHVRIRDFIMAHLGLDEDGAIAIRRKYFRRYGTTLAGLMANHGTEPKAYLDYVHDIDFSPVKANPALDAALSRLPGRKLIFTNADTTHTGNVLARLGITHHFEAVFDIADADYRPKPDRVPYQRIVAEYAVPPGSAVMLDDMTRNLAPAAAMGMTTVWVRNDYEWSSDGDHEEDYIHYRTDDLTGWLEEVAPAA